MSVDGFNQKNNRKLRIGIINGPNINILGIRETGVYGIKKWNDIEAELKKTAEEQNVQIDFYQSNHEGDIVDYIQMNLDSFDGIVINPAALTNRGYSILDALNAIRIPFVEVHLSNIYSREDWHSESIFAGYSVGQISGFKDKVYYLGLLALKAYLEEK